MVCVTGFKDPYVNYNGSANLLQDATQAGFENGHFKLSLRLYLL
jgi:hypothetical protein